jgi:hypothetical protein
MINSSSENKSLDSLNPKIERWEYKRIMEKENRQIKKKDQKTR